MIEMYPSLNPVEEQTPIPIEYAYSLYSLYSLPNTLFLAFLSYEMKYNDRVFLCHLAREICERLYYRKGKIPLYNFEMKKQVIRDMLSTLCSFIDIFNSAQSSEIHLNRIGTNPLEHSFGVVRMRSKDHHNVQRFIEEVNNINSSGIVIALYKLDRGQLDNHIFLIKET